MNNQILKNRLGAEELRTIDEKEAIRKAKNLIRRPIYFILENIYDTYNIGGLFRLADALAIGKIYLVGETETPPNSRIKKASIGTYKVVPWEYYKTTKEVIDNLRSKFKLQNKKQILNSNFKKSKLVENSNLEVGISIIAVEQDKNSVNYTKTSYSYPLALIFGNETYGILPETLKMVDKIVEIPMWGINKSLNVIVSAAIVSYHIVNIVKLET